MITLKQYQARYIIEITGRGERDNLPGQLGIWLGQRATLIKNALYAKANNDNDQSDIEIDTDPFPISKVVELLGEDGVTSSQFFTEEMLLMFDMES